MRLKTQKPLLGIAKAVWPLSRGLDAIILGSRLAPRWLPEMPNGIAAEDSTEATLLSCIERFSSDRALQPQYDLDAFRWLLRQAAEKKMYGALRKAVLRDSRGEIIGWYLYYLKPGQIGEVLQFGGRPKTIQKVLNHLFYDAWRQGAVALSGETEPRFAKDLAKARCEFALPGYGVLMQSKNPDLLNAVHRGNAFLSRLEGEWWARFSDPGWSSS